MSISSVMVFIYARVFVEDLILTLYNNGFLYFSLIFGFLVVCIYMLFNL